MPTRYRFDADDILYNKIRTYPKVSLIVYESGSYLDNQAHSGSNATHPNGHINLYGLNATEVSASDSLTYQKYIHKTPNGVKFKLLPTGSYQSDYAYGDKMYLSLPLTATIEGVHYSTQSYANGSVARLDGLGSLGTAPANLFFDSDLFVPTDEANSLAFPNAGSSINYFKLLSDFSSAGLLGDLNIKNTEFVRKKLFSLKNIINSYSMMSPHFQYSASATPYVLPGRDLEKSELTIINIPSAFYGERINEGSVCLKYYHTGTLAGEARDTLRNGELIHTGPGSDDYTFDSAVSGSVVGLVLYNEGIILLTSSLEIHREKREVFRPGLGGLGSDGTEAPKWINFASTMWTGSTTSNSTWELELEGVNHIPTLTMYAHAQSGNINHSNNPSFVDFDDVYNKDIINYKTGAYGLVENRDKKLYNFVSSSYKQARIKNNSDGSTSNIFPEFSASFKKQVYISKVGIYDDDNNLIAVAKLAQPYRKEESDSISFKLKLDL